MHKRLKHYLETGEIDKEAYLSDSSACPVCNHYDIEGDSVVINVDLAEQAVSCPCCGARWLDTYTLGTVNLIEKPDDVAIEELRAEADTSENKE